VLKDGDSERTKTQRKQIHGRLKRYVPKHQFTSSDKDRAYHKHKFDFSMWSDIDKNVPACTFCSNYSTYENDCMLSRPCGDDTDECFSTA